MERPNLDLAMTLLLALTAETSKHTNASASVTHKIKNACTHERDLTNSEIDTVVSEALGLLHSNALGDVIERLHRALRS